MDDPYRASFRAQGHALPEDDGAHANRVPEAAEGGRSLDVLAGTLAHHPDRWTNRSSKFIAERVQESLERAVPASNFTKALVVTVYERDERRLDWIIESDIGHRPNRSPTGQFDHSRRLPAPGRFISRIGPSREPAPRQSPPGWENATCGIGPLAFSVSPSLALSVQPDRRIP